jgi:hypothetical protein
MPVAFILTPASLAHSALFAGYYSYLNANVICAWRAGAVVAGELESADRLHQGPYWGLQRG